MPAAVETHYRYNGTTIKEAMREVLIEAEMPLKLEVLTKHVGETRQRRLPSTKPTRSGLIARAVKEHPDLFFKFGPFVSLQEWDEPLDFAKFIEHHRARRRA